MGGIIGFILGCIVGGVFGFIMTALLVVADDDPHE